MKRILLCLLVLLSGCASVGSPDTQTPTPTATVEDRSVESGIISLEGQPIQQTFQIRDGPSAPSDWSFPVKVEFQRVAAGNWTETYVFNVGRMEPFSVELLGEERYRIVVEDADGDRRVLGIFIPMERGAEHTIIVGPCCSDDFS